MPRCELFDMHCHLGFCVDAAAAARELAAVGVAAFSNTVTPAEFAVQQEVLAGAANVRVGCGLHPWWVGEDGPVAALAGTAGFSAQSEGDAGSVVNCADVARLCVSNCDHSGMSSTCGSPKPCPDVLLAAVERQRFVGEVGLDFSPARVATREAQVAALSQVAGACGRVGGKVVSLHAVRAVDDVLDVLEGAGVLAEAAGNACIIHWFSGTSDQLTRARRLGVFFSVNPRMLQSKRGRAYAQAIPGNRLLLETDLPAQAGAPWDAERVRQLLGQTARQLAELRGEDAAELQERIAATSRALLEA